MKTKSFFSFIAILFAVVFFTSCTSVDSSLSGLEKTWRNYQIDSLKMKEIMIPTGAPESIMGEWQDKYYAGCAYWAIGSDTLVMRNGELDLYLNDSGRVDYSFLDGTDIRDIVDHGIQMALRPPSEHVWVDLRNGDDYSFVRGVSWFFNDNLSDKEKRDPTVNLKDGHLSSWELADGMSFVSDKSIWEMVDEKSQKRIIKQLERLNLLLEKISTKKDKNWDLVIAEKEKQNEQILSDFSDFCCSHQASSDTIPYWDGSYTNDSVLIKWDLLPVNIGNDPDWKIVDKILVTYPDGNSIYFFRSDDIGIYRDLDSDGIKDNMRPWEYSYGTGSFYDHHCQWSGEGNLYLSYPKKGIKEVGKLLSVLKEQNLPDVTSKVISQVKEEEGSVHLLEVWTLSIDPDSIN